MEESLTYLVDLIARLLLSRCRIWLLSGLVLLNLCRHIMDLSLDVSDNLSLKLIQLFLVGVAPHKAEKFNVIVEDHI